MKIIQLEPGEKFFLEERTANFRKEDYAYIHTGIIDENGEQWTTTELDEANISQVYNQYRAKHGIPFPDEISSIRKHYGLSAAKMSQILGFGINQYRAYEDGEVPSLSNARTIMAAREKSVFLSFLGSAKADMSEADYNRTLTKVESIPSDYTISSKPSVYTGYKSVSLDKIRAVVRTIITTLGPTFVTKMNKLLFYADFLHYKKSGYGITGITYRALQFGPVPNSWGSIYGSLQGIAMEEYVYPSGQSGILLELDGNCENEKLTEQEADTLKQVCQCFAYMNAGEISEYSHNEKAWISNSADRAEISYQEAFYLN